MSEYKYKFSIVVPMYNVEEFVGETIDSVIEQDIGFKENVQIVLVNDGSPDDCESVCIEYQKKYPENIVYVSQENAGVSAARNNGLGHAQGKYVNFLDSDDKWSPDTLSTVYRFFEENADEIDVVSCKQEFFEGQTGLHPLSKLKFGEEDRVIDIFDEYTAILMNVTATFIKTEAAKQFSFDSSIKYGEDALYINKIILKKHKYGVVANPTHFYRKRVNNTSAIQAKGKSLDWYFITPEKVHMAMMDYSRELFGEVIQYIQYMACYEIQWRLGDKIQYILTEEERQDYLKLFGKMLGCCEDFIIMNQRNLDTYKKLFLLSMKYGHDVSDDVKYVDYKLYRNNIALYDFRNASIFKIDILDIADGNLKLSGQIISPFSDRLEFYIIDDDGERTDVNLKKSSITKEIWGEEIGKISVFELSLPLNGNGRFLFYGKFDGKFDFVPKLLFSKFGKLYTMLESNYFVQNGYIISNKRNTIMFETADAKKIAARESSFVQKIKEIIADEKTLPQEKEKAETALMYRNEYFKKIKKKKKEIWLISDRINVAGDNGEVFFKYVASLKNKNIEPYFVISKESDDYKRMKKFGKVLDYGSKKFLLYTLLADKIISSQGDDNILNPFENMKKYIGDLYHYDFVFLQHGIIMNDLSTWLNRYNKNIKIFVTSAMPEYNSIAHGKYEYNESDVKLTGLPRYDNLVQDVEIKKQIVFMPTWRAGLALAMDPVTGVRPYNPSFKDSPYYQFYQKLINDERLINALSKNGYVGKFCVHPNNLANAQDFTGNSVISVYDKAIDYRKEFKENALLITDYSSVAFDFSYLKKPIVYAQPDRDYFFEGQVYEEGYWDYVTMGFGRVCFDYEETLNEIIAIVERDCIIEDKYKEKIEQFYKWFDQDNCKRVFDEICKLPKNEVI